MKRSPALLAFAALLLGSASDSSAFNDTFVDALKRASADLTERQEIILDVIASETSLETMVEHGVLTDVYDCIPELRTLCWDAIHGRSNDTVIYEWGEWWDLDSAFVTEMVGREMTDAAIRGFNLFTNEELATP